MPESEQFKAALSKSMAQCSQKEQCCEDIRKKLALWGVGTGDITKIIEILIKERFIDETRYANAFVRDKFKYNKWGKVKIASHLKFKKIPSLIISQALSSIEYDQYVKLIRNILEVHSRQVKAKNNIDLKSKLLRFGLSKGFESSILYEIIGDMVE
jgi:regulatory protein